LEGQSKDGRFAIQESKNLQGREELWTITAYKGLVLIATETRGRAEVERNDLATANDGENINSLLRTSIW